jgi:hypothetical protein
MDYGQIWQIRAEHAKCEPEWCEVRPLLAAIDELEDIWSRMLALHQPIHRDGWTVGRTECAHCRRKWPCEEV